MQKSINLRSVDLNLLVLFDALMSERHVTRAANKIGVSQSAMSNALSRLRYVFKDELLIRTSRGMEPTPRALELGEATGAILRQTMQLMISDIEFDPANSHRNFVARMSDLASSFILPPLMERMSRVSPGVTLDIVHLSLESMIKALEGDELDIAVSIGFSGETALCSQVLFVDRVVCVMRENHPLSAGELTVDQFLSCGHIRVTLSPTDYRFVDSVLAKQCQRRNVQMNVPHWSVVPQIVRHSDLVAVMSERAALQMANQATVIRELPFPTDEFTWTLYWHKRYDQSPSHQWLRDQIRAVTGTF